MVWPYSPSTLQADASLGSVAKTCLKKINSKTKKLPITRRHGRGMQKTKVESMCKFKTTGLINIKTVSTEKKYFLNGIKKGEGS